MNNICMILNDIQERLKRGEDIEKIIPYDLQGMPDDLVFEIMCIYKKYGKNEKRLKVVNKWFEEKR